jgi:hypothetical protein
VRQSAEEVRLGSEQVCLDVACNAMLFFVVFSSFHPRDE